MAASRCRCQPITQFLTFELPLTCSVQLSWAEFDAGASESGRRGLVPGSRKVNRWTKSGYWAKCMFDRMQTPGVIRNLQPIGFIMCEHGQEARENTQTPRSFKVGSVG